MSTRAFTLAAATSLLLLSPAALAQSDTQDTPDGGATDVPPAQCATDADCNPGEHCGIDGWCWTAGDGPCETDADCGEGSACLYEWCEAAEACTSDMDCWTAYCGASGYCATPPSCTQDADCPDGDICDWGYCSPKGSRCLSDAECPDMSYCDPDYWDGSSGGGASGSGGGAIPEADAGPSADASGSDVPGSDVPPGETWTQWGACVVDPALVTVTSDCQALCAAVMPCMVEGGDPPPPSADAGSAPSAGAGNPDALEQCTVSCSYADTTGAFGEGDLHALLTCVTDNPACDDMVSACGAQVQAVGAALESLPVEFAYEDPGDVEPGTGAEGTGAEGTGAEGAWDDIGPGPSGDTATGEPMDYPDTTAPAQDAGSTADAGATDGGAAGTDGGTADAGTAADGLASADAGATTTPPTSKTDGGGCNAGGTTPAGPSGLLLLGLLGLAALRRRLG